MMMATHSASAKDLKAGLFEIGLGAADTKAKYDTPAEFSGPSGFINLGVGKTLFLMFGLGYQLRSTGAFELTNEKLNVQKLKTYWFGGGVTLGRLILAGGYSIGENERDYQASGQTGTDYTEDQTISLQGYRVMASLMLFRWGKDMSLNVAGHYSYLSSSKFERQVVDGTNPPATKLSCNCTAETTSGYLSFAKGF